MENVEMDKLTELHVNTKNIAALVQQLKIIQSEQQINIQKIHELTSMVYQMKSELDTVKQHYFVMKAMSMGHGSTVQ